MGNYTSLLVSRLWKLLKKSQRVLLKDSTSLKKDLATALKVNKLEKKFIDDTQVIFGLDAMTAGLSDAVQSRFDVVNSNVDAISPSKAADKAAKNAVKLRDQAEQLFATASGEETRSRTLKFLKKANAKIEGAQKQVDKANRSGGGGGGGKFTCDGRAPGPGESGTMNFDGVEFQANEIAVSVERGVDNVITTFRVTVIACNANAQTYKAMSFKIPGEPEVGFYSSGGFGGAAVFELLPPGMGGFFTQGPMTIDSRENGKISGSFVTREDIAPPISFTFTVDDPNAE